MFFGERRAFYRTDDRTALGGGNVISAVPNTFKLYNHKSTMIQFDLTNYLPFL